MDSCRSSCSSLRIGPVDTKLKYNNKIYERGKGRGKRERGERGRESDILVHPLKSGSPLYPALHVQL